MGTEERDRPLAGLVSDEAEALYARLLEAGSLEIGSGPDQVDIESPAARELIDARIAYRSHLDANYLLPVARTTALPMLLARQHADITARQHEALAGWELLDSLLPTFISRRSTLEPGGDSLVEVITGSEPLNMLVHELYQSAKRELLGLSTARYKEPIETQKAVTPSEPALDGGGKFRMIYEAEIAGNKNGLDMIEESVRAGEEARIRAELPLKMLHIDDTVALIALTKTGVDGSLLVHSPVLLSALRQWFEFLWNDEGTTRIDGAVDEVLNSAQRQVLRLMSSGKSDESIARTSGASVRTVRRHITAILEILGVNSRFAAGAMAAKRGWI